MKIQINPKAKLLLKSFLKKWYGKLALTFIFLLAILFIGMLSMPSFFEWYTGVKNAKLTYDTSIKLTDDQFEETARKLTYEERYKKAEEITQDEKNGFTRNDRIQMLMNTASFNSDTKYKHIDYFRKAGIRQYEGPKTCLKCHETIKVKHADGTLETVNTMEDVTNSVHFNFQSMAGGFSTYGYNGKQVNKGTRHIPVGKIDRACGIPGSFSWTGWAALIKTYPNGKDKPAVMRSEGCGACHIGGNYQPATEKMMPGGDVPSETKDGIDCLICHAQKYDMNYKYVIKDKNGYRWNQDRTMLAAMSVTKPTNDNCLNCHQHNMGGDTYEHNSSAKSLGYINQRVIHEGAKRGNPFSKEEDVHAAAGVQCTDCHVPEGHKIPRGIKGTDLVANDLPGKPVECESCHTSAPHTKNELTRVILNGHVSRVACETCHITKLEDNNVVLRDWVNPTWDAKEGMYGPTDILRSGKSGIGIKYLWYNGNGTFLANALGNNPNKTDKYNPLMEQLVKINDPQALKEIKENVMHDFNMTGEQADKYMLSITNTLSQLSPGMIEKRKAAISKFLVKLENMGQSKIYPFKMFNSFMYEDMSNQGPFGAMIMPFDYAAYYETGNSKEAMKIAIQNKIVKRMYQFPFKEYMMDDFMHYFGVDKWSDVYPIDDKGHLRNIEAHWMRQSGTLMVNHGIQKEGLSCVSCHSPNGVIDFAGLGYSPERVQDLTHLKELKYFPKKAPGNKAAIALRDK